MAWGSQILFPAKLESPAKQSLESTTKDFSLYTKTKVNLAMFKQHEKLRKRRVMLLLI